MLPNDLYEGHIGAVAALTQRAFGEQFDFSAHFLTQQTRPCIGLRQASQLAWANGQVVGVALASAMTDMRQLDPAHPDAPPTGWVDLIAVHLDHQRQGHGGRLLDWATDWLRAQGCQKAWLGASIRTFMPGYPAQLGDGAFFRRRGFAALDRLCCDVACDLATLSPDRLTLPDAGQPTAPVIRPLSVADIPDLLVFFRREFPGRWRYEFEQHLADGGRPSDYTLLWLDGAVHGFCQLTFADSARPLERYYMRGLPRPWGQLGAIGVSASVRGRQLGRAILAGGLARLREAGVRGCVIDWTDLLDFYAKFDFKVYRHYLMLHKPLSV
ncbi:MAG: GNAT family N-acetyltransferase [Anaerolineae bacterium]|nr:GNAT family N-acetyltransferase [Anaerolineae bacterium]